MVNFSSCWQFTCSSSCICSQDCLILFILQSLSIHVIHLRLRLFRTWSLITRRRRPWLAQIQSGRETPIHLHLWAKICWLIPSMCLNLHYILSWRTTEDYVGVCTYDLRFWSAVLGYVLITLKHRCTLILKICRLGLIVFVVGQAWANVILAWERIGLRLLVWMLQGSLGERVLLASLVWLVSRHLSELLGTASFDHIICLVVLSVTSLERVWLDLK